MFRKAGPFHLYGSKRRSAEAQALAVVDKNWDGELNFEELCCFLAVYRGSEGFTKEEARRVAQGCAVERWWEIWWVKHGKMLETGRRCWEIWWNRCWKRMLVGMVGEWLVS